jgi:hypothetical protein
VAKAAISQIKAKAIQAAAIKSPNPPLMFSVSPGNCGAPKSRVTKSFESIRIEKPVRPPKLHQSTDATQRTLKPRRFP